MQRIWLLNGNNITYDKDNTAGLLASLLPGIISWFWVTGSGAGATINAGQALIECTRSNGEKIMVFFENTADVAVDMSGTKKVYIAVDQAKIDDGSSNAENGTWVAQITTDPTAYPASNFIALYSVESGTPTDARVAVKSKLVRSGLTPYRLCIVDQGGNETFLAFGANGEALVSGGPSVIPSWQSPSVSIVWLTEKTSLVDGDLIILSDSEESWANKKWKMSKIVDFAKNNFFDKPLLYTWSWGDWNLTVTTGTTSLNPNSIYEYDNVTITWWTLTTNGLTDNWSLLILLVKWTFTMSWWLINMNLLWWSQNKAENRISPVWFWRSFLTARWSQAWQQAWFPVSWATYKQLFWNITCWSWGCWADDWYGWSYITTWGRWGGWIIIIATKINITWGTITANWGVWVVQWSYWSGWSWGWAWWAICLYSLNKSTFQWYTITANWGVWLPGVNRWWYDNSYTWGGWGSNYNVWGAWSNPWPANVASAPWGAWSTGKWFWIVSDGGDWGAWGAWVWPVSWKISAWSWGGWAWWDFYFFL